MAALFVSVAPAELTRPRQLDSDKKFRGGGGRKKKKEAKPSVFSSNASSIFEIFRILPTPCCILDRIHGYFQGNFTQIRISPFRRNLRNFHVSVTSRIQQTGIFPRVASNKREKNLTRISRKVCTNFTWRLDSITVVEDIDSIQAGRKKGRKERRASKREREEELFVRSTSSSSHSRRQLFFWLVPGCVTRYFAYREPCWFQEDVRVGDDP